MVATRAFACALHTGIASIDHCLEAAEEKALNWEVCARGMGGGGVKKAPNDTILRLNNVTPKECHGGKISIQFVVHTQNKKGRGRENFFRIKKDEREKYREGEDIVQLMQENHQIL